MTAKKQPTKKPAENPLVERLVSFGFSLPDARIYVYLALPRLIEYGLVDEVPHGKQNKYKARPPAEIEKIGRKRALFASDLARDLNMISNIGNEQDFEVIQGKKAIRQFEMSYVERSQEGSEEFIIGGASSGFSTVMGDYLEDYLAEKRNKNIRVKYIGSSNEIDVYRTYIGMYANQEYRFMEKLPQGVTHMVIRPGSTSFYSFLTPPLVYVVKSQVVAENYKQFFLMLWEIAGKEGDPKLDAHKKHYA